MSSGSPVRLNLVLRRFSSRFLLVVLLILGLMTATAYAQTEQALPPSVVLVLKLVSATHVEPVTGIVVGGEGLVLVPADFVSTDGEIIVLDGGADIVKHGRPATVVEASTPGRLAVLSVSGLVRTGITLSANTLEAGSVLHLSAFPPAEDIARGAPPVRAPVGFSQDGSSVRIADATSESMPYVAGPILDSCGYLAGISLTSGPQSLQPGKLPSLVFGDDMKQMLEMLPLSLATANCALEATDIAPGTGDRIEEKSRPEEPSPEQTTAGEDRPDLVRPEVYKPFIPQKRLNPFQGTLKPKAPVNVDKPSIWRSIPPWLLLLGLISLSAITWKGVMFWRLHRSEPPLKTDADSAPSGQDVTTDISTAQPVTATSRKPRSMPSEGIEFPDMDRLPQGCDGLVVVDGLIDSDMRFQRFCAVDTGNINVILGRGEADISINHPLISWNHARLESRDKLMTLSDLGSDSGTFISGVPCLPGEIMVVEAGDEIFLGDVRIRFSIIHREADPS